MRLDRAEQILRSSETVHVTYQGEPIWIEALDPTSLTAQVKRPMGSDHTIEVPVDDLIERLPQTESMR